MTQGEQKDQAEQLERALQGAAEPTSDMAALVAVARLIQALPQPEIDLSFADALEAKILASAQAPSSTPELAASEGPPPAIVLVRMDAHRRRVRRSIVAAIAAAFLVALPIAASASAAPGSALYGLRLGREGAHVWMQCRVGAVSCGFAHLDRANARLHDLRLAILHRNDAAVEPTAIRLRGDLKAGTQSILGARPSHATLRRLALRIDQTSSALASLVSSAPGGSQGTIASVVASGDELVRSVRIALGESDGTTVQPPVALGPVITPPPSSYPPAKQQPHAQPAQPHKPKPSHTGNSFGPGGTIQVKHAKSGEQWQSDSSVSDTCPLAAVGAPGVAQACGVVKGPGS